MKTTLEYATFYHSLGWSLIPIRKDDSKKPAIKWEEYQTRRATMEELQNWFAEDQHNMGLVCGEISGVAVIDSDSYKAQGGQIQLASKLTVKTPNGGTHYYYQCPKELRPSVNEELAVDIRANGSYVLLPPSIIKGKKYQWLNIKAKEDFNNIPLLPLSYLEKIKPQKQSVAVDFGKLVGVSEGSRDISLYKALCSVLNRIPDQERETQGLVLAYGINSTYKPPLPEEQVKEKLAQAIKFIRANPLQKVSHCDTIRKDEPQSREDRFEKVKKLYQEGYREGIKTGYPSLNQLTHGLQLGQTYLLFADTNVGKSVFALNILINIAKQGIACCYFDLENPSDFTFERMALISDPLVTKKEWDKLVTEKKAAPYLDEVYELGIDTWALDNLNDRFGSTTYEAIETVIRENIKQGVKVFVLDHLHYFSPSETDHSKLADIARKLNTLAAEENITIIEVAHTKKGLAFEKAGKVQIKRPVIDDINGSKLIAGHNKNIIAISRNEQADDPHERTQTVVYVIKTKSGPTGKFNLVFNPEKLTFKDFKQEEVINEPFPY